MVFCGINRIERLGLFEALFGYFLPQIFIFVELADRGGKFDGSVSDQYLPATFESHSLDSSGCGHDRYSKGHALVNLAFYSSAIAQRCDGKLYLVKIGTNVIVLM